MPTDLQQEHMERCLKAIGNYNIEELQNLLQVTPEGFNINSNIRNNGTLLHKAIYLNQPEMVEMLIKSGANVDQAMPGTGYTPMHLVAKQGNVQLMELLIRCGANVAIRDLLFRWTPMFFAVSHGSDPEKPTEELVKTLITVGDAAVNDRDWQNTTPLHLAAANGNVNVIQYLITKGAEVNANNLLEIVPLDEAFENGHIEAIIKLIIAGGMSDRYAITDKVSIDLSKQKDLTAQKIFIKELLLRSLSDLSLEQKLKCIINCPTDLYYHLKIIAQIKLDSVEDIFSIRDELLTKALTTMMKNTQQLQKNIVSAEQFKGHSLLGIGTDINQVITHYLIYTNEPQINLRSFYLKTKELLNLLERTGNRAPRLFVIPETTLLNLIEGLLPHLDPIGKPSSSSQSHPGSKLR